MTTLNILMVHEAAGGGSGRQMLDLSEGLIARGHRVSLVYSPLRAEASYVARAEAAGFQKLMRVGMRREIGLSDLASLVELRRLLSSAGPHNVIHAHSSKAGALARMAAPLKSARIYTPHAFRTMDPTLGRLPAAACAGIELALALTMTDALIAVSQEEADHAIGFGVPRRKLHVVANGVTPFDFPCRRAMRRELGLREHQVAIGFVGRLAAQKDPLRFCAAIKAANARDSRIVGVMIGAGDLESEVRASGAPIAVLGACEARPWFAALDGFALTSRYEGLPYVLLEALQAGLPIISSAVGGAAAVVQDGINGRVLDKGATAESFAEEFLALIDPALRAERAAGSRALASRFSVAEMVAETERVYRTVLGRKQGRRVQAGVRRTPDLAPSC